METLHESESSYVELKGDCLLIEDVIAVALGDAEVKINDKVLKDALKSTNYIAKKAEHGKIIYGVTTGFGSNANKVIKPHEKIKFINSDKEEVEVYKLKQLQVNLLRSHACGVGKDFPEHIVRAIMIIRLNTLLRGYSGVQESTLRLLQAFINLRIHPKIPEQGSVGSSGDLCPLSHMALALIGEGYVTYNSEEMETEKFFERYGTTLNIEKVNLSYKEGLALNNGTTVMTAVGVFALKEAEEILKVGLMSSCLFFEALCVRRDFFGFEKIHEIRKHKGQIDIAKAIDSITKTVKGSISFIDLFSDQFQKIDEKYSFEDISKEIISGLNIKDDEEIKKLEEFLEKKKKPQDSYSVRCTPQVFGASLHAIRHIRDVIANELNAAVDNPLIFVDEDRVISGGNFHGQPVALVMDYLKLAVAEIGNIIERQINKLVDKEANDGLPGFLINDGGFNSGMMIPQYAAASLVSENKVLVHPASADSIPTCANTEDHVSMGTIAARQALQITNNVKNIAVIAILSAHHGFMLRKEQLANLNIHPVQAKATNDFYNKVKELIPAFYNIEAFNLDRFLYNDQKDLLNNWGKFVKISDPYLSIETDIK